MVKQLSDPNLSDADRKLLSDIQDHGWHVVKVLGEFPEWAFTVGLHQTHKHPEIVLFGLPPDLMHHMLNEIGSDIAGGQSLETGKRYDSYLENVDVAFQPVHNNWYNPLLGFARWYYGGSDFPVFQCCWPDMDNNLPWDDNFNSTLFDRHPLLYESTAELSHLGPVLDGVGEHDA